MEKLENLSFEDILNNEVLVNDFVEEKHKDYNYMDFIFDTIPNFTNYEVDATRNLYNNIKFKQIQEIFEKVVNESPYENDTCDYSFFLNEPLQSLTFAEQYSEEKKKEEIFKKSNTLKDAIEIIGFPIEFYYNEDNKDYLKIKSSMKNYNNYNKNNVLNKNNLWEPSIYTITIDNTQQLNPKMFNEFINFCFKDGGIMKNSIKLSILGIILNTKDSLILQRLGENTVLLKRLSKWLRKEKNKPTTVLTFLLEVLKYLPISLLLIKQFRFQKVINDILKIKTINEEIKKSSKELLKKWNTLNSAVQTSNNTTNKPVVINIQGQEISDNSSNSDNNKRSDLFDKILSTKKPQNVKSSSSNSEKYNIDNGNIIDKNSTAPKKLTINSKVNLNTTNNKSSPISTETPSENKENNEEILSDSALNLDISSIIGPSPGSVKRAAVENLNDSSSKRFKPNSNEESLHNITLTKSQKPLVSILKKSNLKKGTTKKSVSFKPDGTINQYRLIYEDGRDLYSKNKSSSPIENNSSTYTNSYELPLKLMEIPVYYDRLISEEEKLQEDVFLKKLRTSDYILDKNILYSPKEALNNKTQKNLNLPLSKITHRLPLWSNKLFLSLINKEITFEIMKKPPNHHPNLKELYQMQDLLRTNEIIKFQIQDPRKIDILKYKNRTQYRLFTILRPIYNSKIPKTSTPLDYLYKRLKSSGIL